MLVWCFFRRLEDEAVLRLPIDRIAPNSVSWAFAGNSTGFEHWQRENIIFSRLPRFWRFFGAFSAVSKTTLSCAYPLTELHQTRFLGLLQAIPLELSVETGKHHYKQFATLRRFFGAWALQAIPPELRVRNGKTSLLADCHGFGVFFGAFSAVSKTTLSCTYPLTKLHQTRILGLLEAIPPESSVGNGKTSLLADCHGFGVFLALFRPSRRQRCPALTH